MGCWGRASPTGSTAVSVLGSARGPPGAKMGHEHPEVPTAYHALHDQARRQGDRASRSLPIPSCPISLATQLWGPYPFPNCPHTLSCLPVSWFLSGTILAWLGPLRPPLDQATPGGQAACPGHSNTLSQPGSECTDHCLFGLLWADLPPCEFPDSRKLASLTFHTLPTIQHIVGTQ
jgi:hypothetical protein